MRTLAWARGLSDTGLNVRVITLRPTRSVAYKSAETSIDYGVRTTMTVEKNLRTPQPTPS